MHLSEIVSQVKISERYIGLMPIS